MSVNTQDILVRETSPGFIQQQAVSDEFDQVKAIVKPFHDMYGAILDNTYFQTITRIVADQVQALSSGTISETYTVYNDKSIWVEPESAKGRAAFPPDTSVGMQTSIMKLDSCDTTVAMFLPHLSDNLREIGARVDWVVVDAIPYKIFHYEHEDPTDPQHSVFSITTCSGNQFIADFTIEQFGYDAECWFSRKSAYLELYTEPGSCRLISEDEVAMIESVVAEDVSLDTSKSGVRTLCISMDWETYRRLPSDERFPWLHAHVQAFSETWYRVR